MPFNVEAARADGVSEEAIQAILASEQPTEEITTEEEEEEVVVTPEPPQPKPTTGFDVEAARADNVSEEAIQAILASEQPTQQTTKEVSVGTAEVTEEVTPPTKPTFNVEAARADGVSEEAIQAILASEQPTEEAEPSGYFDRYVTDPALALAQGVIGLGEAAIGLADIPTLGYAGKGIEAAQDAVFGGDLQDLRNYLQALKTPEQLAQEKEVSDAEGFTGTLGALVNNPAALLDTVLQTIPQMIGGAAIARKALTVAGKAMAARGATFVPNYIKAAAFGEGVVAAGASAESIRQQTEEGLLSPVQSIAALGTGVLTGMFGLLGGKVATKLGLIDIDAALAGQVADEATKKQTKNALVKLFKAGIAESAFEEMPQSGQEQIIQNLALNKPPLEGVAEAMAEGAVAGFALAGTFSGSQQALDNYKVRKQEKLDAGLEEREVVAEEDQKNRGQLIKEELSELKKERQRVEAREIKKTPIKTFDEPTFKKLGISGTSTAYKTLKNVDLSTPEGLELAEDVLTTTLLDKKSGGIKVNKQAVKNSIKQIQKSKEGLVNAESTTEGQGTGTSNTIPDKSKSPATESIKKLDTGPVDINQSGAGGDSDTAGTVNNPLIDNAKNPILKNPKVGTKARIGRVVGDKVEVLKGVIEDGPNGFELVSKEGKGTIRTPLNNEQVLNPTKKDITQLETLAPRIKENKAKVKSKKQQLLESKKEENKKDIDTKEKELNEAGFESYEEFDQDGNSIKGARKIREKKPSKRPGKFIGKKIIEGLKEAKTLGQVFNKLGTVFKERLTKPQASLLQKLRALPNIKKTKFNVTPGLEAVGDVAEYGTYTTITDSVAVSDNADAETVLHESTHAATALWVRQNVKKGKGVTALGRRMVNLYEQAKQASRDSGFAFDNELATMDEFITEAFNNQEFQKFLAETPSTESTPTTISSLWTDFVEVVTEALGLSNIENTLLNDVISLAPELFKGPNAEVQAQGPNTVLPKKKSLESLNEEAKTTEEKKVKPKTTSTRSNLIGSKDIDGGSIASVAQSLATSIFSFDYGLNMAIREQADKAKKSAKEIQDVLRKISISQALHVDELAQMFIQYGNIVYNEDTHMFDILDDPNSPSLIKIEEQLKQIAKKMNEKPAKMREYASKYFQALRSQSLKNNNIKIKREAQKLINQGKDVQANNLYQQGYVLVDMTDANIKSGLKLGAQINKATNNALDKVQQDWIATKNNVVQFLVDNEIMSQDDANDLIDAMDTESNPEDSYVPFFREGEKGPQQNSKGLGDSGTFQKIRGSYKPVNNLFDNMNLWISSSIKRGVLNKAAINKVEATQAYMPEGTIREVVSGGNEQTATVMRRNPKTGTVTPIHYQYSDPVYATALRGLQNIILPGISFFSDVANILRSNIVLYPLFSIAQLPQDAASAMFSSGLNPISALMIPLRVLKEFPLTLLDMSKTHTEIKRSGAVGGFSTYLQGDMLIDTAMDKDPGFLTNVRKQIERVPGLTRRSAIEVGSKKLSLSGLLNRIAMASDNAVRQAVYEQTMMSTNDRGLALERAFEVINFRRAGSASIISIGRQTIPFFGAALQALSVQGRVISGRGITGTARAEGVQKFLTTAMTTSALTLLYAATMAGDEEYEKLDTSIKDRRLLFGNGAYISLRPDIFTFIGKILPEHVWNYMYEESEDSQKFKHSLGRALADVGAMNFIPQLVRPFLELQYNYSARLGRSIVPQRLEDTDISLKYTAGTTELAKLIGRSADKLGLDLNPIKIDYFLRQYFGYSAGLATLFADEMIKDSGMLDYERATPTDREAILKWPGTSAFIAKEYGNRATSDFYELKADVTKAYKQYKDLISKGWDRKAMLEHRREHKALIRINSYVKSASKMLSGVRVRRQRLIEMPKNLISADRKRLELDKMNRRESKILSGIRKKRKLVYDSGLLD